MADEQPPTPAPAPRLGLTISTIPGPWGEFPSPSAQELSRLHRKMGGRRRGGVSDGRACGSCSR